MTIDELSRYVETAASALMTTRLIPSTALALRLALVPGLHALTRPSTTPFDSGTLSACSRSHDPRLHPVFGWPGSGP